MSVFPSADIMRFWLTNPQQGFLAPPCAKRVEIVQNSPFDWVGVRELLKSRLGSEVVSRWLDPLSVASVTDRAVILEAPNVFFRDWIATHYLEALQPHAGGRQLQIVTASGVSVGSPQSIAELVRSSPEPRQPPPAPEAPVHPSDHRSEEHTSELQSQR